MEIIDALAKIGFDWRVALANLVNFLIVFWLLKRFVFAPMQSKLKERKEAIEKGIEDAQIAERDRVMAKEKYEETVKEARVEATAIVSDAREKEKAIVSEAQGKAEEEARRIKSETEVSIEKERSRMQEDIRKSTAEMIVSGVEKILKEEVDEKKNEEIINSVIKAS